jgi:phosphoribosylformylglycinamidine synthase
MAEGREALDFASVQRADPEMQRRAQAVIDVCVSMGEASPIASIHDVGAGGLSNAITELLEQGGVGGRIDLRAIPSADASMSPLAIWCNEAQERYALAVEKADIPRLMEIAAREACPLAVVGETTEERRLVVEDAQRGEVVIDLPLALIFGELPRREIQAIRSKKPKIRSFHLPAGAPSLREMALAVLRHPVVASKGFLITIADRSVTGLVARDQMVGAWQTPISDCAVVAQSFTGYRGEAMALGERPPVALWDAAASARLAVAEAITGIAAAAIEKLSDIKLCANWMAASGDPAEDAALFDAVHAIGRLLCPALGIAIPVGKDSLSMQLRWKDAKGAENRMRAPLSLVVSALAPVTDIRKTTLPLFHLSAEDEGGLILLVDLGRSQARLGGSICAQILDAYAPSSAAWPWPDLDEPADLIRFFEVLQGLRQEELLLAYHDRSDGGLWGALCEMAFAARCGFRIDLRGLLKRLRSDVGESGGEEGSGESEVFSQLWRVLFCEEVGAVLQIRARDRHCVMERFTRAGLGGAVSLLGEATREKLFCVERGEESLLRLELSEALEAWSAVSHAIQKRRDDPSCALEEREALHEASAPLYASEMKEMLSRPFVGVGHKPEVAILRTQGSNGYREMAAAFMAAGFEAVDLTMTDLREEAGLARLAATQGMAICGGFSYGDTLGAGWGWASEILHQPRLYEAFSRYFANPLHFILGVCNGCQMLSHLTPLIPEARGWPRFRRNRSDQFEARMVMVRIEETPSLFFQGMAGASLPIFVAHAEGRACFAHLSGEESARPAVAMRYLDPAGIPTQRYPYNPNGSPEGIAAITDPSGRMTLMMPHPERCFRTLQMSWHPPDWGEESPWMRLFHNARLWVS